MRAIDEKFHVEGDQIIKTTNGDVVPEDEPLFLVRARDYLAIPLLEHYRRMSEIDGCNEWHLERLEQRIRLFEEWRDMNPDKMKQPGVTRGL